MIRVNAVSQIVALGITLVIQVAYMAMAARVLGAEDFGRMTLIWVFVQILLIGGDLGLHNTGLRRIAARDDRSPEISGTFFFLKLIWGGLLTLLLSVVAFLLPDVAAARIAMAIFGAGFFFHSLAIGVNIVFQAHGKLYFGSLNVVLLFLVQALLGAFLLLQGLGLYAVALAYAGASVFALLVNLLIFRKQIHPIVVSGAGQCSAFIRESVPVGIGTFFSDASVRIGPAFLTPLVGNAATGVFGAASRITQSSSNLPTGVISAVLPTMAAHQEDRSSVRLLLHKSLWPLAGISVVLAAGFYLAAEPLIRFLYGPGYAASAAVLSVLAFGLVPRFINMAFGQVIYSQASQIKYLPWVHGAGLLAAVVANYYLISAFGAVGAAYAVIVVELVLLGSKAVVVGRFFRLTAHRDHGDHTE